jgi:hypothetical protein
MPSYRFIQRHCAGIDQCHERRGRNRFRHRSEWEEGLVRYGYSISRLSRIALGNDLAATPHRGADAGDTVWTDPFVDLTQCLQQGPSVRVQTDPRAQRSDRVHPDYEQSRDPSGYDAISCSWRPVNF